MSDELKIRIKMLTSWIVMAFSANAPKGTGARMGAAFLDRQIRPIHPLPLHKFSPTSENFFPFLPDLRLATYHLLLPRASRPSRSHSLPRCGFPASSGWFLASSGRFAASWCTISFLSSPALLSSGCPMLSSRQAPRPSSPTLRPSCEEKIFIAQKRVNKPCSP
jgi:hypothetical protein